MAVRKKNPKEEKDTPVENTSPVCYANSPELRPGFNEESDKKSNTNSSTVQGRKTIKPRKTNKP